jgi:Heterokaryon incompatibility protein (HET)
MVLDLLALGGVFVVRHVAAEISRQKRAKEAARRTPAPSTVSHSVPQSVPSSSNSVPVVLDRDEESSSSSSSSASSPRDLVINDASSSSLDPPFDSSSDASSSTDSVAATSTISHHEGFSDPRDISKTVQEPTPRYHAYGRDFSSALARQLYVLPRESMYGDLNVSNNGTRLLILESGDGQIQCQLGTIDLSEAHSYEALSYHWGGSQAKHTVMVGDLSFDVTDNLYDALSQLRNQQGGESRILWVDQLCIDQENKADKDKHLPLMKQIYSQAKQVIIWLGKGNQRSEKAARIFMAYEGTDVSDKELRQLYSSMPQLWRDLSYGFFCRLWWTRAWIIQEVMLTQNPIAFCGSMSLSFDLVLKLICFASSENLPIFQESESPRDFNDSSFAVHAIQRFRDKLKAGEHIPFGNWVAQFSTQRSKYPQDRVFAFLGLADDWFYDRLRASTGSPVDYVWTDATTHIISENDCLDFICLGHGPGRGKDLPKLPSWVPDLTLPSQGLVSRRPLPIKFGSSSVFDASAGSDFCGYWSQDLKTMTAAGFEIDTILEVSDVNIVKVDFTYDFILNSMTDDFLQQAFRMTKDLIESKGTPAGLDCRYPGYRGGWYEDALNKTLMMDLRYSGQRLKPEENIFSLPREPPEDHLQGCYDPEARMRSWEIALHGERHGWTSGRRFITTEKGYIGVATSEAVKGDVV